MRIKIIIILALGIILAACNKEAPKPITLKITPSSTSIESGEMIDFTIEGEADFLVFYSGLPEKEYSEYPNALADAVNMQAEIPSISNVYSYHGTVTTTFVATTYGNWGEDKLEEEYPFVIQVTDNNTKLKSATLKTEGIFGDEFFGVIDEENSKFIVTVGIATEVASMKTNFVPSSPRAKILLDGAVFENNTAVDYSAGVRSFTVESPGGATETWEVVIEVQ